MSARVHTNCAVGASRKLPLAFGGNAIGIASPNSLNSNLPKKRDAMGKARKAGIITVVHDGGAGKAIKLWLWNEIINKDVPAQGWVGYAPTDALSTQSVDGYHQATFTNVPEDALIFITTTTAAITNGWIGGCDKYADNPLADLTPTTS